MQHIDTRGKEGNCVHMYNRATFFEWTESPLQLCQVSGEHFTFVVTWIPYHLAQRLDAS